MWFQPFMNIPIDIDGTKKNRRKLAQFKNMLSFQIAFARLAEDALNRYKIDGLPDTISLRVVLQSLLWHASVIFFEKAGNLFALPGTPSGEWNIYGEPAQAQVFSMNGIFNEPVQLYLPGSDTASFLKRTDMTAPAKAQGVIVWENKQRFPFINSTFYYAERISDTLRTLDVCRENIKTPQIFFAEESVVNTVKKFLEEREENVSSIISTGVFEVDKVKTVPIDPKGTALSDVTALIEWYESKYRELCGLENNAQMDKKGENLIQAEVDVNDEYTALGVDKCVETLQEGFDYVNKIFGTNITVDKKEVETNDELRTDDADGQGDVSSDGRSGDTSNNS